MEALEECGSTGPWGSIRGVSILSRPVTLGKAVIGCRHVSRKQESHAAALPPQGPEQLVRGLDRRHRLRDGDGTVSIFGLVAGVALTAISGTSVLVAGAAGAVAAAVSMMAGVFLDLQSEQDRDRVDTRRRLTAVRADPTSEIAALIGRLGHTGLQPATLAVIQNDLEQRPVASSPWPTRCGCSFRICSQG